jgi:hypothetical protein
MRLLLIGQHKSIFIGNLGLCWIYFDRIIAKKRIVGCRVAPNSDAKRSLKTLVPIRRVAFRPPFSNMILCFAVWSLSW